MRPYLLDRRPKGGSQEEDFLSPAEKAAQAALIVPKRRADWLAGRLTAKRLIVRYLTDRGLRVDPSQVEVLSREDGSPRVRLPEAAGRPPSVSISHSEAGSAAALRPDGGLIGVDQETVAHRHPSFLSMMAHEEERTPALDDPAEQTLLWTLKEAVSKALGVGLSVDLWDIRFVPGPEGRRLTLHGRARERWEALGRPTLRFESFPGKDEVTSVAYADNACAAGEAHA